MLRSFYANFIVFIFAFFYSPEMKEIESWFVKCTKKNVSISSIIILQLTHIDKILFFNFFYWIFKCSCGCLTMECGYQVGVTKHHYNSEFNSHLILHTWSDSWICKVYKIPFCFNIDIVKIVLFYVNRFIFA